MTIGLTMLLVGSATWSYFDDIETSAGNTFLAGDIDLRLARLGDCEKVISFLEEDATGGQMLGVTDDTSGWSHDSSLVNLGVDHIDLDIGDAYAYENGGTDIFSHRGTRGLGCLGEEDDEVDCVDETERIEILFDKPEYLNRFEIRLLFNPDTGAFAEVADVDLYLDGVCVKQYDLVGQEDLSAPGTDGDVVVEIDPEILVDKIVFYVDQNKDWSEKSEFSVARIWLAPLQCYDDDEFNLLGAIWTIADWKPGEYTDGRIWFCDVGGNYGGTLYIACDYTASDPVDEESDTQYPTGDEMIHPGSTDDFASYIQIAQFDYYSDGTTLIDLISAMDAITGWDYNGNGYKDLEDLKYLSPSLSVALSSNGANDDHLYMKVKFHHSAGNEFQGDVFDLTMMFNLEQIMYP